MSLSMSTPISSLQDRPSGLYYLGVYKYEAVRFSTASRAFHCRQDIDDFFALYEWS
jgi:hypothetical protein